MTEIQLTVSDLFSEFTKALEDLSEIPADNTAPNAVVNGPLYQTMLTFFSEDDWAFAKIKGEPTLQLAFQGTHGRWNCYAHVNEEHQRFLFYSVCAAKASVRKRKALSEFLTRANYGMLIGNFEFDFEDGEIRYKTSVDVRGDWLTSALIRNLVYANVAMMDEYLPGIMAVLSGEATPEAAIRVIEKKDNNIPISASTSP